MAKDKKKGKIRADFRKKHDGRKRQRDFTRAYEEHGFEGEDVTQSERISGKGELTRKRTIVGDQADTEDSGLAVYLDVDESVCRPGRVLSVHGLSSVVRTDEGDVFRCATRGLLKSLSTEQRHVVAAGDRVWIRPDGDQEGFIERIEPRHGVLSRSSRGRQHVLVANVDQVFIVASAAEPRLKPNLIDRFLVSAEKAGIRPIICINKIDLVAPADLQPLAGVYGQMGYQVVLVSAESQFNIAYLRKLCAGQESVFTGQSGVGKSSLLNAIEEGLDLKVNPVSAENQKGKHTTTAAKLIPLSNAGFVVDTPGIRQFQLWDVIPEEVAGYFRDIRCYVSMCRYPDCTHIHEDECAVKDAVADGRIDLRRYESYCGIFSGDL